MTQSQRNSVGDESAGVSEKLMTSVDVSCIIHQLIWCFASVNVANL